MGHFLNFNPQIFLSPSPPSVLAPLPLPPHFSHPSFPQIVLKLMFVFRKNVKAVSLTAVAVIT